MPEMVQDALSGLSEALVERARGAKSLVAGITVRGRLIRSGTLWRKDVVVGSEQSLPDPSQNQEVSVATIGRGKHRGPVFCEIGVRKDAVNLNDIVIAGRLS